MTSNSLKNKDTVRMNQLPVVTNKSKKTADIQRAKNYIDKGYRVLVIMRGLPGSGKSYLAKEILQSTLGTNVNKSNHILSTDDYFCQNPQGQYIYDPRFLEEGHNWNQRRAFELMSKGYSPVIIDNTNTQMWEMKPYATMATDFGYIIEILEPNTHWCFNDKELTKRSQHGVPKSKINDMLGRYEKNVTPQKLLCAYNLLYNKLQKPPQLRLYPPPNKLNSPKSKNISESHPIYTRRQEQPQDFLIMNQPEQKEKIIDTIDLMDFNDDNFQSHSESTIHTTHLTDIPSNSRVSSQYSSIHSIYNAGFGNNGTRSQNSVDEILMCTNDSNPSTNSNILLPEMNTNMEVILVDSSDEENSTKNHKSKSIDIESSWGVNEDVLRSWDIVTPLVDCRKDSVLVQTEVITQLETKDASCFTEDDLLTFPKNPKSNVVFQNILETVNRDINRSTPVTPKHQTIPKKIMIDKSCMTEDIFEDYDNHMLELLNLFPTIPKSHLHYWYNKCKGDLEWTIEFLLEAKDELDTLYDESDALDIDNKSEVSDSLESESKHSEPSSSFALKSKKFRKSLDKDNELKKLIESKVDINDKYYSKHVLKVKNYKFSKPQTDSSVLSDYMESTTLPGEGTSTESKHVEEAEIIILDDSDVEFDDTETDNSDKRDYDLNGTIELNLGEFFVSQLEKEFGSADVEYPKGFQPVVQVPESLARQLYAFYMESVYQQMENQRAILETLTKEDEEFARKLQAKEQEAVCAQQPSPTLSFKEIIDEQVAQSYYEKETMLWKNLDPDTLAAKLTRQKLFNTFPNIDQNTLLEILHAHGNKYEDTIESLLVSTGMNDRVANIEVLKEPPIKDAVLEEMKEAKRNNIIEVRTNK